MLVKHLSLFPLKVIGAGLYLEKLRLLGFAFNVFRSIYSTELNRNHSPVIGFTLSIGISWIRPSMPRQSPKARDREASDECLPKLQVHAKVRATSTGLQTRPAVTDSREPYQYTRLKTNQIRVLSVSIEQETSNFVCSFHVRNLASSQGAYKAISYCWGNPTCSHRVLCSNGQSLHVTQSAADIFNFVVAREPTEFFWIDQLCISQQDLVEKSEQVQQMGRIYSSTKQVIAWLGRGDRRDESALAFVEMLFGEVEDMEAKAYVDTHDVLAIPRT